MKELARLFRYLRGYGGKAVLAVLLMTVAAGANLIQPILTQRAIDFGVSAGATGPLVQWSLLLIAAAVLSGAIHLLGGVLLSRASQGMAFELRNDIFRHIMSFSFANLDTWRTGELLVRTNSDVETVRGFVRMGLFLMLQSIITLIGSLVIMVNLNAELSRIMIIMLPSTLGVFFVLAFFIRPLWIRVREKLDALNNVIQENLSGAKVVRAFARQEFEKDRFGRRNTEFLRISLKVGYIVALAFPFLFLLGRLAVVLVSWIGGSAVIEATVGAGGSDLTLGQLIAFNEYALLAVFPIMALGFTLSMISRATASATRIEELLAEEPAIRESPNPVIKNRIAGRIEITDVCFAYGGAQNAIDQINLTIAPGEKIGILGRTGSGKTSLAALIPRLYDVDCGAITIDGVNVQEYALDTLRSRVNLILQETVLLSGTILENVTYAYQSPDGPLSEPDERVRRAAELACALEFIEAKENGWHEHVGERGTGLSGGQRQRVAIARALLADPDVLILDDVTSAVDASTERQIVTNLYNELQEKSVVVISQKVNSLMRADRIVVMEEGRVAGMGTHAELLASNATYRKIYDTQSAEIRV